VRNNTRNRYWVGSAAVLLIATATLGQSNGPDLSKLTVLRDIEYVPGGHERQKLDLYLPKTGESQAIANAKRPLVVWVHGGAWLEGNKNGCPAVRFTKDGYAVASINYRLSQHAIFPAQIQDCKAAIRWLRANADKHGIDPNRIGVWGASAGGHLVALLGTAGDVNDFDVGPNAGVSSRVQAVCDFFGPTDFTKMSDFPGMENHDAPDSPESKLVGGPIQENKDKVQRANPITYVTKDDPPFLIVHGDADPIVPYNQSEILRDALVKAGMGVTFYTVRGGGHGGFKDPQVEVLVTEFFNKHLRKQLP
jgi:acetyl esterase/lipase